MPGSQSGRSESSRTIWRARAASACRNGRTGHAPKSFGRVQHPSSDRRCSPARRLPAVGDGARYPMDMNVKHLSRYKDIARLLGKYGRSDLVKQMAIDEELAA